MRLLLNHNSKELDDYLNSELISSEGFMKKFKTKKSAILYTLTHLDFAEAEGEQFVFGKTIIDAWK